MIRNKGIGFSVFTMILTIFLIISVIFTFSISYMFSTDGISGKLFGKYVYIMENDDMMPEIEKGSAVISDENGISVLVEGNVILFKNGSREDVMRIRQVVHNTENTVYVVSSDARPKETIEVSKDNVIAKCVTEGKNLGGFISFLSSIAGIIIFMILPCAGILAMLIMKILSMKKTGNSGEYYDQNEAEYYEDEEDEDDDEFVGFNGRQMRSSPLFYPESDVNPDEEFERKKSSIAQNFSRKPGAQPKWSVRNRQEPSPREAVEKFKAAVEEKPNAPVTKKPTLIPENVNPVRDEKLAAIKAALSGQDDDPFNIDPYAEDAGEKTVEFKALRPPKIDPDQNHNVVRPQQRTPRRNTASYAAEAARQTGIKPTAAAKPAAPTKPASRSESINSIDDLIKALEEEKRKL